METYFSKFPTITYNNQLCVDITKRVKIIDTYLRTPSNFYTYEIKDDERADNVSYNNYNDPFYDWLFYMINNVSDTYYDWYMSQDNFDNYIKEYYGNEENAIKRTMFYRTNWYNDESQISTSYYDTNLPEKLKKYYSPVFGINTKILYYKRREEDLLSNTNKIINAEINYISGESFTEKEIIDFSNSSGSAEVISSNSTNIIFQHVEASVDINLTITGETSTTQATIISYEILSENITKDEEIYWERVSAYDFESEENEKKKFIDVISSDYILDISEQFRKKMKE